MLDLPSFFLVIEVIRAVMPGDGYIPTAPLGPMTLQQCEQLRPTYDKWPGVASATCRKPVMWKTTPGLGLAEPVFDN